MPERSSTAADEAGNAIERPVSGVSRPPQMCHRARPHAPLVHQDTPIRTRPRTLSVRGHRHRFAGVLDYEQPLVPPQVMHLRHDPLRTSVKLPQLPHASPS